MKKTIFTTILILIPVMFFLLIEVVLRLTGFGTSYPLFIQKGDQWHVNQQAAAKYFSSRDIMIPELIEQSFPVAKADKTIRILCLGGSTTAGYPYEVNINFPFFLKLRLEQMYPIYDFELINLGIAAVNSYTVMDIADQLNIVDPDLVLIYMGHNEFYGALGAASSEFSGFSRPLIKLMLMTREWRLYQALQSIIDLFRPENDVKESNLMRAMIAKQAIPFNSEEFDRTHANFKSNLEDILDDLSDDQIPVIMSTVASNIRDQRPLSALADSNNQEVQPALKAYHAGTELIESGDHMAALEEFMRARDLDLMRFRASEKVNEIIRRVTNSLKIPLADIDDAFIVHARYGIPGNDLFLEHLHPNPAGYDLMALTFIEKIIDSNLLEEAEGDNKRVDIKTLSGYTLLDELIGELKIQNIVSNYPFNGQTNFRLQNTDDPIILKIAKKHVSEEFWWDEAHFKLGDYFIEQEKFLAAAQEFDAVRIVTPGNPTPYYKLARVAELKNDFLRAERLYNKSIELHPRNHFLYAKLGMVYLAMNRFLQAIETFETVIKKEGNQPQLSEIEQNQLFYYLAVADAQIGELKKAKSLLEQVLKRDATHSQASDLLIQIDRFTGQ